MKDEYDFPRAERGKFYYAVAEPVPPVHLEPEILRYIPGRATSQGTTVSALVNRLLKKDIKLIEVAK